MPPTCRPARRSPHGPKSSRPPTSSCRFDPFLLSSAAAAIRPDGDRFRRSAGIARRDQRDRADGAAALSMELMPRITRAQSMDALSSMATIAGYKGVLLAADSLPRMFPMLMTAAGTLSAAKVFIVGAGVAGLQAIATSRRLGAKVEAYDVQARRQGAGAEPGRALRRDGARNWRCRGQRRLREGAGRSVLPASTRDDVAGRRRERRGHHHCA